MIMMMSGIKPHETKIVGQWIEQDEHVVGDENCQRIEHLTRQVLKGIEISDDGWDLLYQDRADGRYWELIHPAMHLRHGGPPSLIALDPEYARKKYRLRQVTLK